jgi:hypothetical protein
MRPETIKLLNVVALLVDKPVEGLAAGHVCTVAEVLSRDVFEVEFLDLPGRTFVLSELKARRDTPFERRACPHSWMLSLRSLR